MAHEVFEIDTEIQFSNCLIDTELQFNNCLIDADVSGEFPVHLLPGLSAYELAVKHGFEGTEEEWLASLQGGSIKYGTAEYWEQHGDIIPKQAEFIIISDYSTYTDADGNIHYIPAIKVGNGYSTVNNLSVISGGSATDRLNHTLTIGDKVFDGSRDVVIEVYTGETTNEPVYARTAMTRQPLQYQMQIN